MNKQDKELLLQDLCARLPYKCKYKASKDITHWHKRTLSTGTIDKIIDDYYDEFKPYLRPLSSITEDEEKEFNKIFELELKALEDTTVGHSIELAASSAFMIDFYNKHHFDYRGLIPMGLAIEAPEGMYVKNK